jgi:hypothetical protein
MSGFETKIAIKNLGSNIIYLAIIFQLLISIPVLSFISFSVPWVHKPLDYLKKKLLWNGLLKFLMQQYGAIIISSGINMCGLTFDFNDKPLFYSSILSITLLSLCLIGQIVGFSILKKFKQTN